MNKTKVGESFNLPLKIKNCLENENISKNWINLEVKIISYLWEKTIISYES